jgi:hypothetical protein
VKLVRKVAATTLFFVGLMCFGICFIVFIIFHDRPHAVLRVAEIGIPAAIVLALVAAVVYPGRPPVPGGQ